MDNNTENEKNMALERKGIMHYILFGDYVVFFVSFILGVIFDLIFPSNILSNTHAEYLGLAFIILGTILIYWAQLTSARLAKNPPSKPTFTKGPYKFIRNPTHTGVVVMMFGFALIIHSLFSIVFLIIADVYARRTILKKQDKILLERYGENFEDYKKKVKDLI